MTKNAPRDAHSREEKICRKRPRETPECAKAHSQTVDKVPAKAGLFYIYNRFSGIMGLSERRCFL